MTLKPPHTKTYAEMNAATACGVPLAFLRLRKANNRIMGAALGSIMAIIMNHHMKNIRRE